eukprot:scaffold114136_cov72-Phaeocystis_antarctica.AAC.2
MTRAAWPLLISTTSVSGDGELCQRSIEPRGFHGVCAPALVNQGCAASGRREKQLRDICCKNTHISHSHIALTHCTHIALGG